MFSEILFFHNQNVTKTLPFSRVVECIATAYKLFNMTIRFCIMVGASEKFAVDQGYKAILLARNIGVLHNCEVARYLRS